MTRPKESRPDTVRRMFSNISPRYDLLNRLLSAGRDVAWRRVLAASIPDGDGPVLDVATGTGDVPLAVRRAGHGDRRVLGVDFAMPMLKIAARKFAARGARGIGLAAGDAFRLPVRDGTFAAATIAFGLRNLPDRVAGLREMARTLSPGGLLLVLELSPVRRPVMGPIFRFYFHRLSPWLGGLISSDRAAYRYLPRSVDAFPDPDGLAEEMRRAGLVNVRCRRLSLGIACLHVGEKPGAP